MAAVITSTVNAVVVTGLSRDDVRAGDVVSLAYVSLPPHTTFSWTLLFAPKSATGIPSTATLTTPNLSSCSFTVDNEGPYLVRLVVDLGLPTESKQEVRIRYITKFGKLKLVAGGEKRDTTGIIPVDQEIEGWSNAQNFNLQALLTIVKRNATSGRVFFVDANRGKNDATSPNVPFGVEDNADYSLIQTAINAATASTPAPSLTSPYLIIVNPGLYIENLTFYPNVHILGVNTSSISGTRSVVVRTNAGFHQMNGAFGSGDNLVIENILFENNTVSTDPVIHKNVTGSVYFKACQINQNGISVTQGPALLLGFGTTTLDNTTVSFSDTTNPLDTIVVDNGNPILPVHLNIIDSKVIGPNGLNIGESLLPDCTCSITRSEVVSTYNNVAAYCIQSESNLLSIDSSRLYLTGGAGVTALTIHPSASVKATDVVTKIKHSVLEGAILFDATNLLASKSLEMGAVEYGSLTIIGTITQSATVNGDTILYDNTVSSADWGNVQQALDQIAAIFGTQGIGASALSLDTAYDGVLDALSDPPIFGSGAGRTIFADQGSVRIIAADPPNLISGIDEQNGGLQVEGNIEVGAIDAAEIKLRPNPFSVGPSIELGNLVWPSVPGAPDPHRAVPAATILAKSTESPLYHNYNLTLGTQAANQGSNDHVGNIIIQGGDSYPDGVTTPDAGDVLLQAGYSPTNLDTPGSIVLSPGASLAGGTLGYVTLTNPVAATPAILQAENAVPGAGALYPAGGTISFFVAGYGLITATVAPADDLAAVQATLNTLPGITCAGNPLTITTFNKGVNADVIFASDDQGNLLNIALGNFEVGSGTGAIFTPGTTPEFINLDCHLPNTLRINGNLVVTGGISGSIVLSRIVTDIDYPVAPGVSYIGVDTVAAVGNVLITLPSTVIDGVIDGREVIIKDEGGNAAVNNIIIKVGNPADGNIDNLGTVTLTSAYQSIRLVCNGLTGVSCVWYIV